MDLVCKHLLNPLTIVEDKVKEIGNNCATGSSDLKDNKNNSNNSNTKDEKSTQILNSQIIPTKTALSSKSKFQKKETPSKTDLSLKHFFNPESPCFISFFEHFCKCLSNKYPQDFSEEWYSPSTLPNVHIEELGHMIIQLNIQYEKLDEINKF